MTDTPWLALLLGLMAAWAAGRVCLRHGYPPMLGELLLGVLLGWAGLLHHPEMLQTLGAFGVVLMLVAVGATLNLKALLQDRKRLLPLAMLGFLVPALSGYGLLNLAGLGHNTSLMGALVLGNTALVTTSRLVVDLKLLDSQLGRTLLGIAALTIVLVMLTFSLNQAVSGGEGGFALFPLLLFGVGLWLFPKVVGWAQQEAARASNAGSPEKGLLPFLIGLFLLVVLSDQAGLGFVLGAFLAGVFMGPLLVQSANGWLLAQLKVWGFSVLSPLFYVAVGAQVQLVWQDLGWVLLLTLLALLGKGLTLWMVARLQGSTGRDSTLQAISLNARGGIDLVLLSTALGLQMISQSWFSILVLVVWLCTLTVPLALKAYGLQRSMQVQGNYRI